MPPSARPGPLPADRIKAASDFGLDAGRVTMTGHRAEMQMTRTQTVKTGDAMSGGVKTGDIKTGDYTPSGLTLLACGALAREILAITSQFPDGMVDLTCLPASWHNHPEKIVPALPARLHHCAARAARLL